MDSWKEQGENSEPEAGEGTGREEASVARVGRQGEQGKVAVEVGAAGPGDVTPDLRELSVGASHTMADCIFKTLAAAWIAAKANTKGITLGFPSSHFLPTCLAD